jgi:hypothetical protein
MKSSIAVEVPIGIKETATTIKADSASASPPKVVLARHLHG